jgi:hypothetical protein
VFLSLQKADLLVHETKGGGGGLAVGGLIINTSNNTSSSSNSAAIANLISKTAAISQSITGNEEAALPRLLDDHYNNQPTKTVVPGAGLGGTAASLSNSCKDLITVTEFLKEFEMTTQKRFVFIFVRNFFYKPMSF